MNIRPCTGTRYQNAQSSHHCASSDRRHGGRFKTTYELFNQRCHLEFHTKYLTIHWKIWFLYNTESLALLDLKLIWVFDHARISYRCLWSDISCKYIYIYILTWKCTDYFDESSFNKLTPRQNGGRHFADDIFKCIFVNENIWISIGISLKFVPRGLINNIPGLVEIMAWRRSGDKPLSEPMMSILLTHICVTRPQWVKLNGIKYVLTKGI